MSEILIQKNEEQMCIQNGETEITIDSKVISVSSPEIEISGKVIFE